MAMNPNIVIGLKLEEISKSKEKLQQQVDKLNGKLKLSIGKLNLDVDVDKIQKKINTLSKGLDIKISKLSIDNTTSLNKIKKQIQTELNNGLTIDGNIGLSKIGNLNKDLLKSKESAQALLETLNRVQAITFPHITESKNTIKEFNSEAKSATNAMNNVVANSKKLSEAMKIVNSQEKEGTTELKKQETALKTMQNTLLKTNNTKIKLDNGKEGSVSRTFDGDGNIKNATVTTNFDKQRQEVQKYGWTVKQVGDDAVREFTLLSTKIVDNKSKLQSSLQSQSQYFENLRQKVLQLKQLNQSSSKKLGNYDENGKNLEKIIALEKELYNLKRRKTEISPEEMNKETQNVANLTREIKSEIDFKKQLINTNKFLENQTVRLNSLKKSLDVGSVSNTGKQSELISSIETQEAGLKRIANEKRAMSDIEKQSYTATINSIKIETSELLKLEGVRRTQSSQLINDQDKFMNKVNAQIEKMTALRNKNFNKLGNYDQDKKDLDSINLIQKEINKTTELTKEKRNEINQILSYTRSQIQENINKAKEELSTNKFINQELNKIKEIENNLKKVTAGEKKDNIISNLSKQKELLGQIQNGEVKLNAQERERISNLNTELDIQTRQNINMNSLSATMQRMGRYFGAGTIIFGAISELRKGIQNVIDLNSSMVDLKKVTSETSDTYFNFGKEANETAVELGHTTKAVIDATAQFSQASFKFNEAKLLAKNSLIYSNVGDISQEEASKSMISTMKGFNIEAENSLSIIDKINNVSNNFAVSAGGLGDALQRSASALHSAGNDLDQSLAMIATANTVAQDPTSVGTGLKTISMRLRGVKEGADELNPKLQSMIKSITGVNITKQNGQFKSTYEILNEISKVWDKLNDKQHAYLAEQIAGKHQANIFLAMMEAKGENGGSLLSQVYGKSTDSKGSAMKEQEAYMRSLAGTINKLKENIVGMWSDLLKSSDLSFIINGINSVITGLRGLINTFGALPTVIGLATGAIFLFNKGLRDSIISFTHTGAIFGTFDKIKNGINGLSGKVLSAFSNNMTLQLNRLRREVDETGRSVTSVSGIFKNAFGNGMSKVKETIKGITTSFIGLKNGLSQISSSAGGGIAGGRAIVGYISKLGLLKAEMVATKVVTGALRLSVIALDTAFSMGLSLVLSIAISKLVDFVEKVSNSKKALDDFNKQTVSDINSMKQTTGSADGLYKKIKQTQDELAKTTDLQKRQQLMKQLNDEQVQMAGLLKTTATGYDKEGKLIANNNKIIEGQIHLQKQLAQQKTKELFQKNSIGNLANELKESKNEVDSYENSLKNINNSEQKTRSGLVDGLDKANKKYADLTETMNNLNIQYQNLKQEGKSDSDIEGILGISSSDVKMLNDFNKSLEDEAEKAKNSESSMGDLKSATDDYSESLENAKKDLDLLTKNFTDASNKADVATEALEEMNKYGGITKDTMEKILATKDPHLISALQDGANATQVLTGYVQEQTQAMYDNEQKAVQMASVQCQMEEAGASATQQATNAKGQAYQVDAQNHNNTIENKAQNGANYSNQAIKNSAEVTNNQAKHYENDSANWYNGLANKLESMGGWAGAVGRIMNEVSQSFNKALKGQNAEINPNVKMGGNIIPNGIKLIDPKQVKMIDHTRSEMESFDKERDKAEKKREKDAKKREKENKVDIKDIHDKIDGYKTLSTKLDDVNSELDRYDKLADLGSLNDRNGKLKDEIGLLNRKKQAILDLTNSYENERNTLASILRSNGFNLDDNNIYNYFNKLQAMQNQVNSMANSNKAKQGAIDHYNTIKEQADRYMDLIGKIKSSRNSLLDIDDKVRKTETTINADPLEDLKIDRYKVLEDHLQDINNELEKYKTLQDNGSYASQNEYLEKQIELYNRKKTAIQDIINASQQEAIDIQNKLNTYGLDAYNGNIDNYEEKMAQLKSQIYSDSNPEEAEKQWKKLQDLASQYWDLTSSKIPDLQNQILGLNKSIDDANKTKFVDPLKDIEIDKYKQLDNALTSINNKLDYTKTLEEQASGTDKLAYMNEELELYKKQKEAIENLAKAKEEQITLMKRDLVKQGFQFDEEGNISNYVQNLEDLKNKIYNATDKDKAKQDFDDLNSALEKYFEISNSSLPDLKKQWLGVNSSIKELRNNYVQMMGDTEREVTSIIKDQIDKRKKAMEDETNKVKENIQKQKEAYDQAYNDKDYKSQLAQKQDDLNKIQAQIDEASRNNSDQGQAMLEDLLNQKKQIQDELNKMIESHEHEAGDKAFDDESSDLDKKLQDKQKELDEKYSAERIAEMAKTLIQTGSVEIEGQIIHLSEAVKQYYKEQGDVYSDSSKKMQDFIDKLEETKKLYADLITMNKDLGVSNANMVDNYISPRPSGIVPMSTNLMAKGVTPSISVSTPLHIENMNGGSPEELQTILDANNNKVIREIQKSLYSH